MTAMKSAGEVVDLLEAALLRRASLLEEIDRDEGCLRLVHADGDGLDGLTVDRYGPALLVEQHRREAPPEPLVEALTARFGEARPIFLKRRCSARERALSGSQVRGEPWSGELVVVEDGLRFAVELARGEHTGLFLDGRPARRAVERLAEGRRVLNLFAYTGGFGLAAVAGGARSTTNVDNKRTALERARGNYQLNGASVDTRTFLEDDALRFLNRSARGRGRWDLVVVDPPPRFRRPGGRRFDARRGFAHLVARCLAVLDPGGLLLVGLNARTVDDDTFEALVTEGGAEASRRLTSLESIGPGPDFPPARYRPTARFLLCALS